MQPPRSKYWSRWSAAVASDYEVDWGHELFDGVADQEVVVFLPGTGVFTRGQGLNNPCIPALTDGTGPPVYTPQTGGIIRPPPGMALWLQTPLATGRIGLGTAIRVRHTIILPRGHFLRTTDGINNVYYGFANLGDSNVDFGNGNGAASNNRRSWTWAAPTRAVAVRPNATMSTAPTVYTDGTPASVSANGGTATSYNWGNSTTTYSAGRSPSSGTYVSQNLGYFIAIEGSLSTTWMAELSANPYQIIKRRTARLYSFPTISAAAGQTISPPGIATAEGFGTTTIARGAVAVTPAGIDTLEALGDASLIPGAATVAPSGAASAETFGSHTVTTGNLSLYPSAIAGAEAFGTLTIAPGVVAITPTAIAGAEAFGTAAVTVGALTIVTSGIASAEAFGTLTIAPGPVTITCTGIASAEAVGNPAVAIGQALIQPLGIAGAEAFGTASISGGAVSIVCSGISSGEAFGTLTLTGLYAITPTGIASAEVFGTSALATGAISLSIVGIASAEAFGVATFDGGDNAFGTMLAEVAIVASLRGTLSLN